MHHNKIKIIPTTNFAHISSLHIFKEECPCPSHIDQHIRQKVIHNITLMKFQKKKEQITD